MKSTLGILFILVAMSACGGSQNSPAGSSGGGSGSGEGAAQANQDQPEKKEVADAMGDCKLDQPVKWDHNPLDKPLEFVDVVLDQDITEREFATHPSSKRPLKLSLFPIYYSTDGIKQKKTQNIGGSIAATDEEGGSVGFSNIYVSSFNVKTSGGTSDTQDFIQTEEISFDKYKTDLRLIIDKDNIIAVQIAYPTTELKGGVHVLTGKQQTLCVKSMKPKT